MAIIAFVATSCKQQVSRQTRSTTNDVALLYGDKNTVLEQIAKVSNGFSVRIFQTKTTNTGVNISSVYGAGNFQTAASMSNWMRKAFVTGASQALTNAAVDRDKKLNAIIGGMVELTNGSVFATISSIDAFSLISSTGYSVPDFSNIKLKIAEWIPYSIPGIVSASLDVCDQNGAVVQSYDSATYPTSNSIVDVPSHTLLLPSEYMMGGFKIKLTTLSTNEQFQTEKVYGDHGRVLTIRELAKSP